MAEIKSPNDYPLLGYRVFPGIKDSLVAQLEDVLITLNNGRPKGEKPLKKNEVFVLALKLGLRALTSGAAEERGVKNQL